MIDLQRYRERYLGLSEYLAAIEADLRFIEAQPDADDIIRLKEPDGVKQLVEEIWPTYKLMAILARLAVFPKVQFIDQEKADCRLMFEGSDAEMHGYGGEFNLQITTAIPENEHLVREKLSKDGFCWGDPAIHRDPKTKTIIADSVAVDGDFHYREMVRLVEKALIKKNAKGYPDYFWLLINIDLNNAGGIEEDITLRNHLSQHCDLSRFSRIYTYNNATGLVIRIK